MAMDSETVREMMSYYDERADEYDDVYRGRGHTSIDPEVYKNDVAQVAEMVSGFGRKHLIDIACGAGFWLPYYARNCSHITFLDQSERMLAKCRDRVEGLGFSALSTFAQGDFFELALETSQYDCALVGFFLSHLTSEQEEVFFGRLRQILKPNPPLMLIDSAWNRKRQRCREKEGIQERALNDGRRFKIYKRYFAKSDIERMFRRHCLRPVSYYVGDALIAAIAVGHG